MVESVPKAIFTLPQAIAEIASQNQAVVYGILFRAIAETLRTIAALNNVTHVAHPEVAHHAQAPFAVVFGLLLLR